MDSQAALTRAGIEAAIACVGIVLFLRMRRKERASHGDLADAKLSDLPIVLKGSRTSLSALIVGIVLMTIVGAVLGVAAYAAYPHWLALVSGAACITCFGFAVIGLAAIIHPKPVKIITITSGGISIQRAGPNTGEYAWRDIIGISNGTGPGGIIANDWLALYVSPEVALRRKAAKTYSLNPNLVNLANVQGFGGWDLSPLARLIDRYRQVCTGLPPLYKRSPEPPQKPGQPN